MELSYLEMLAFAALYTVMVETAFFACFREYRKKKFLVWCVGVNLVSNLTLNLTVGGLYLLNTFEVIPYLAVILSFEVLVVVSEFVVYGCVFGFRWKLFFLTFAANSITYLSGVVFEWLGWIV